jgi:Mitochondrial carrier protein
MTKFQACKVPPLESSSAGLFVQIAATSAGARFQYRGTVDAFVRIMQEEGFAAFFRGSIFAYCKVVPSIGVMYMLYDLTSHAMAVNGLRMCDPRLDVFAV